MRSVAARLRISDKSVGPVTCADGVPPERNESGVGFEGDLPSDFCSRSCAIEDISNGGFGEGLHGAPLRVGGAASLYGRRSDTPVASPNQSATPTGEVYCRVHDSQTAGAARFVPAGPSQHDGRAG
jgi:hypothetical protein